MANLNEIAAAANDLSMVKSARVWKDKRVYIDLYDSQKSYRGDQSYQLFFCADRGWVSEKGKGTTSSGFDAAVAAFEQAMQVSK